jgi:endoglycosylceramidase
VDHFYTDLSTHQRFLAAWSHVAARLADAPAVIGFDTLNEPGWGSYPILSFEADRLEPFDVDVVNAVRSAAPSWLAFIEPAASRNGGVPTGLLPFDLPDVVYAPHSYDAAAEGGAGFDPSHRGALIANIGKLGDEARALGAALWIGEYGGVASAPGIADYMDATYQGAGAVAAGTMYWAYDKDSGYALLDASGAEKPVLVDAVVRPYPELVAGDPVSWSFDAASSTFTFTYRPDPSLAAATEIAVPARRYPSGYQVACGGCAWQAMPGRLVVTSPPPGATTTVTITR